MKKSMEEVTGEVERLIDFTDPRFKASKPKKEFKEAEYRLLKFIKMWIQKEVIIDQEKLTKRQSTVFNGIVSTLLGC